MRVKKIFAIIAALCITASLAACGNNAGNKVTDTSATADTAISEEVTEAISEDITSEGTTSDVVPTPTEGPALPDTPETLPEETEAEVSESHIAIVTAIEEVIAAREHTAMVEVSDPVILKEFFLIDTADTNIKEAVVYQCPMSAVMSEIIVLQADDVEAAKEVLNNRRTKAIEQDAFYPKDAENAEASIVGTVGNYAYFVINDNAIEDSEQLASLLENME